MIYYRSEGYNFIWNIFRLQGSVYRIAFSAAIPSAIISFVLRLTLNTIALDNVNAWYLQQHGLWASFSSLLGFLVVFRTSQAYARFWGGCTSLHRVKAEWFDACSALIAFCKFSEVDPDTTKKFQMLIVRMFGMLYTLALAHIEDSTSGGSPHVRAFDYELVGAQELDAKTIISVKESDAKVELVYQWIQQLIVENISKPGAAKVLNIPPPILSRVFQQLGNGMAAFHEAIQISFIPFPFPYAQCCSALIAIHWVLVPFVVCGWSTSLWIAPVFSFLQVFILWSLNSIATEIENPFGTDSNDVDGLTLQTQMNRHLEVLLEPSTIRSPKLNPNALGCLPNGRRSMAALWADVGQSHEEEDEEEVDGGTRSYQTSGGFGSPEKTAESHEFSAANGAEPVAASMTANIQEVSCMPTTPSAPSPVPVKQTVKVLEGQGGLINVLMDQEWRTRRVSFPEDLEESARQSRQRSTLKFSGLRGTLGSSCGVAAPLDRSRQQITVCEITDFSRGPSREASGSLSGGELRPSGKGTATPPNVKCETPVDNRPVLESNVSNQDTKHAAILSAIQESRESNEFWKSGGSSIALGENCSV